MYYLMHCSNFVRGFLRIILNNANIIDVHSLMINAMFCELDKQPYQKRFISLYALLQTSHVRD